MLYVDSSLLLSIILEDSHYEQAYYLWENNELKVSSKLIQIESIITIKRLNSLNFAKTDKNWLKEKIKILAELLKEINLLNMNNDVIHLISENDKLANVKSLDAIHIATALIFQKYSDEKLTIGTFDNQFKKLCKELNFF